MIIYDSLETNFNRNGYGFLTDCISAQVIESLNGDYTLTIEYPINGKLNEYLIEDNIIKSKISNGDNQLFRIKRVEKNFSTIKVYAMHITYDLLNNFVLDSYPKNLNASAFGQWILDHTDFEHSFTFYSDISKTASGRYVRKNPIDIIIGNENNSMINLFGGDIVRDNFNIRLLANRGTNNKIKLMFGKNIKEIKMLIDITSLFTRIYPIGFDGLTIPEGYIDSPIIGNYATPKICKVEFSDVKYDPEGQDESAYTNLEEAQNQLRLLTQELFANGIDKPQISIKIDWLELSKTEQYKKQYQSLETVNLGDTVIADILGLTYTTRITKVVYNPLSDMVEAYDIGTITKTIANTLNNQNKAIEDINPTGILDTARNNATSLITSAMGGYIYKTNEELFIMDTDDPNTAQKVWRWNINGLGYSSTGINGEYGLAMTMDGQIVADMITTGKINTNVIEGYDSLVLKVNNQDGKIVQISADVDSINAKIQEIADITTSGETTFGTLDLDNVNTSEPIYIKVSPIDDNISYTYPHNNSFPQDDYDGIRILRFLNKNDNSYVDYEIPGDLLYFDENTYDEFILDYASETCIINQRCDYNSNGEVIKLDSVKTNYYDFPLIELHEGNYTISLLSYNKGYLNVRLIASNIYTTQFYTKIETDTKINASTKDIELSVNEKLTQMNGKVDENTASIKLTAEQITNEVKRATSEEERINGKFSGYSTTTEMNSKINQTAENILSTVSSTYTTKDTLKNYSTTTQMNSAIDQKANEITSSVSRTYTTKDSMKNYSTTTQMNTAISQKITDNNNAYVAVEVGKKVNNSDYTHASIVAKINDNTSSAIINADKISLAGKTIDMSSQNISINSNNFSVNNNGDMTCSSANITGGTIDINTDTWANGINIHSNRTSTSYKINADGFTAYNGSEPTIQLRASTGYAGFKRVGVSGALEIGVNGSLDCYGQKNRVVEVDNNKHVRLSAYETATPYFGDIGSNKTNNNGECKIDIENIFSQTIEKDDYKVFIQECGDGKLYVEKHQNYFIVKGTQNLNFDWEVKAIQKGFKNTRLEEVENNEKNS